MKFTNFIIGFQLIVGALCASRNIEVWMNTAKQWATDVCDILEPYVYAPNTPPNDRIMQLATRIFGANDIDTMFDVYRRFNMIRYYTEWSGTFDTKDPGWKQTRDNGDLEIYCNADHIIQRSDSVDGGVTYWDTTREEWISNDDPLLDLKDPSSVTVAVTSPAKPDGNQLEFPENWSEYMAFNPSRLQTTVEKGNIFDDNTVAKALSPSLLRRIQRRNARAGNTMCQIDILNTLTHLVRCGASEDLLDTGSYGWHHIREIQSTNNAENLAYFAMIIQLQRTYKLDVDDDGNIVEFD
ncbi:uncharacterized protein PG998_009267 [Apiospora kogelbergensis]|uniref:uncharacterized protein n=1 Tax=Apiospora kogelbergensis TaxID=1337665 RepID=UPI00313177F4